MKVIRYPIIDAPRFEIEFSRGDDWYRNEMWIEYRLFKRGYWVRIIL